MMIESSVCGIMGGIDDIMCDDIICKHLHVASVAGMDDMTCDDLIYEDLSVECVRLLDRLMI